MTGFDMTESIAPKSDQLNAEDLLTGPRTFTVERVSKGSAEQPVDVHLVEFPGRPFRPSKTVRRIMVNAWGPDASTYAGKRMTLYRDPAVRFGGQDVGGIRVSHMSGIDKPLTIALTVTRGKRAPFVVQPLPNTPPVVASRDGITPEQLTQLNAVMEQDHDLTAGADKLAWLSGRLGRQITGSRDVTRVEADRLIQSAGAPSDPTLPEHDDNAGAGQ